MEWRTQPSAPTALGCNTFQIFSSSPRQWKPYDLAPEQRDEMVRLRAKYDLTPLVIHANYLVNLAGGNPEFHAKSIAAFRAEIERALALQAEFLVLHPGSFRGGSREEGLQRAALAIEQAADGLDLQAGNLRILIENTAGSEFSLGGNFEQVAELLYLFRNFVPCGACIDTCHTHVAGYDIVSQAGYNDTLDQLDRTIGLQQRVRVALQRRQGRVRIEARSPPEHRQGNHRPGALPPPAQRQAPGQRGLHRGNSHRRTAGRPDERERAERTCGRVRDSAEEVFAAKAKRAESREEICHPAPPPLTSRSPL